MPELGERRTRKDGLAYAEWNGSVWVERPVAGGGGGTKPRPEYGEGAYETSDGSILRPTRSGSVQIMRGPQTAGAEARSRLAIGLGPTVEAQKNLYRIEGWDQQAGPGGGKARLGSNPYDTFRGGLAEFVAPEDPNDSVRLRSAKNIGGQRYQDYVQAAKSFESSFLPILSGAAVTPTEAERMIAASLPQPGDSPQTLASKAKNRAMMINAAAKLLGEELPFPRAGIYDFGSGKADRHGKPAAAAAREFRVPLGDQTYVVREK